MTVRVSCVLMGLVVFALGLAFYGSSIAAEVAEPNVRTWTAGVDVALFSDYIWRGVDKYDTSLAPSAYVRFPSFCVRVSGIGETGGSNSVGEIDASFAYFLSAGDLDFSLGYMFYGFDESPYSDTSELFGTAAWNTGSPITPSLSLYWDIDEAKALYGRVGVAYADHVDDVNFKLKADLGAATSGFSETYFWVSESGVTDFEISFSMIIPIIKQISFEPFVGYSVLVNSSIKDYVQKDSNEYAGAAIHITF